MGNRRNGLEKPVLPALHFSIILNVKIIEETLDIYLIFATFVSDKKMCHDKNSIFMKVLIDIPDAKAPSLLEVLRHISYVETKLLTDSKAFLMSEIRDAVEEMKLIRAGKKKARNIEEFLNEL
jgi:hypothetical protein